MSRGVVITAAGVGESISQLSWSMRWLIRPRQLAVAYRDLGRMEQVLARSGLDPLAVRALTLLDGPPRQQAKEVERYGLTSTVTPKSQPGCSPLRNDQDDSQSRRSCWASNKPLLVIARHS